MTTHNWLEIAKRRYPQNCVGGSGRFAVYTPGMGQYGKILLFATREEAQRHIVNPKQVEIIDLSLDGAELLARIPDRHYERERRG